MDSPPACTECTFSQHLPGGGWQHRTDVKTTSHHGSTSPGCCTGLCIPAILSAIYPPSQASTRLQHCTTWPARPELLHVFAAPGEVSCNSGGVVPSPSQSPPAASPFPHSTPPIHAAFSCELCGQGFQSMRSLSAHRRTHACDRPYHCGVCQLTFSQSSELARHIRSHRRPAAGQETDPNSASVDENRKLAGQGDNDIYIGHGASTEAGKPPGGTSLILTSSQSNRNLLRYYQAPREADEEGQVEPQQPSPYGSPSQGSLESGDTGGSGESGIASGNCTPKRPEREDHPQGEWEREVEAVEMLQNWQQENERKQVTSGGGKKKKEEACEYCGKFPQQQQPDGPPAQPHWWKTVPLRPLQLRLCAKQ